nr:Chain B, NEURAL WISKOTT-ALDRICH SYNDROME PROTEIN [Homo sapiens]4CC2_D Chain D, NEURAL WISKOTT-ALDRICH SYNDROME PROTEIN [Homo sapiens]4CC7_B Chain B, NEURAL WISKOTT-ALDRICH SYNDROME PROTEIN [Homo sapiens]4CC7_D Chain D, NEURAL WISKOTT-ALDRICH SYNDROME PROTEIN [Homo sapiens]4CC7_F Chain F, NEURAL WISKOTT-ALDRICH SYNDROME PROTEIN [Homo sapiens]4CC7_H Chain H, NEURAL WISKOTT-ALDRICH SYNDROME PROTEIN [Homo sapiens]4CC7_J Chain J, NEURAL WISKOTT-ALDRICH SYNDROME PROTEIN [Homo sapiens]4CC7_L Cha
PPPALPSSAPSG